MIMKAKKSDTSTRKPNLPIMTWDGRILSDQEVKDSLSKQEGKPKKEIKKLKPIWWEDLAKMTSVELDQRDLNNPNLPEKERKQILRRLGQL